MQWSFGAEFWSGVLEQSGVKFWSGELTALVWTVSKNHTRILTLSLSIDVFIRLVTFYDENNMTICHNLTPHHSNALLQNWIDRTANWLPFSPDLSFTDFVIISWHCNYVLLYIMMKELEHLPIQYLTPFQSNIPLQSSAQRLHSIEYTVP